MDEAIEKTKPWLWRQRENGVFVGSICSGALILAKMGLLDKVQCTTHWKCLPYARAQYPRAQFLDDRLYIFDKGMFTSAGMTAGVDMALALVEKWFSPLLAAKVAQEMVINVRRADTKEQKHLPRLQKPLQRRRVQGAGNARQPPRRGLHGARPRQIHESQHAPPRPPVQTPHRPDDRGIPRPSGCNTESNCC